MDSIDFSMTKIVATTTNIINKNSCRGNYYAAANVWAACKFLYFKSLIVPAESCNILVKCVILALFMR